MELPLLWSRSNNVRPGRIDRPDWVERHRKDRRVIGARQDVWATTERSIDREFPGVLLIGGDLLNVGCSRELVYCVLAATLCRHYLRKILIHGARSAVLRIKRDRAPIGAWLDALDLRTHKDVVVVATANKLARIAWAVLLPAPDNDPTHTLRLRDLPLA